ncbi:hypothetical protein ACFWBF_00610 [Streptomyces sp. NPDC060028]
MKENEQLPKQVAPHDRHRTPDHEAPLPAPLTRWAGFRPRA